MIEDLQKPKSFFPSNGESECVNKTDKHKNAISYHSFMHL